MKQYCQKRDHKELKANNDLPVWPVFKVIEPPTAQLIYRWYDRDGNYKGWTDLETSKKFLLGQLYYKTKGAYRVDSQRLSEANGYFERGAKKVFIYEKGTSYLAGFAIARSLSVNDLIDMDDREALAKTTHDLIQNHNFNVWNYENFPNPYKLIPAELRTKLQEDLNNFFKAKKQEMLDYCQTQIVDAQNAKSINAKNTEATKGRWDISKVF